MPSAEQRAYFAGYFDAAGCVMVSAANHGASWRAIVGFGQTKPNVLHRLHGAYGGNLYQVKRQRANWRPKTNWQLSRFGAVACLLTDILPFLGEKREQVEAVMQRFSSRMKTEDGQRLRADLSAMKKQALDPKALPEGVRVSGQKKKQTCVTRGCTRRSRARRLCTMHYQRSKTSAFSPTPSKAFTYSRVPTAVDKAYFAGYFDGDGNLDLRQKSGTWHLTIYFNQTRPEGVLRLRGVYGGLLALRTKNQPRRHLLSWVLSTRAGVLAFLYDIVEHSIEKRDEIRIMLSKYRSRLSDEEGAALLAEIKKTRA